MKKFYTNRYTATLLQLFAVFCIFFVLRIFYFTYNFSAFETLSGLALIGGFLYDFMAVIYLNILFILIRIAPFDFVNRPLSERVAKCLFVATNSLGIIFGLIDTVYYPFTGTRMRANFINEMIEGDNGLLIVWKFIPSYWYLVIIAAILIGVMILIYNRIKIAPELYKTNFRKHSTRILAIIVTVIVIIFTLRGGLHAGRPVGIDDAINYAKNPKEINLVLNTPYTIIRSIGYKGDFKTYQFMDENETKNHLSPLIKSTEAEFKPKNVVMIIMEGIGSSFLNTFTDDRIDSTYKGITPFLDSLAKESYICFNTFPCGKRSVDGITAIMGGFPAYVPFVYMKSQYNSNQVDALSNLLVKKGYNTTFFCGCNRGSYCFESLSKAIGYKTFYGRDEYGNDDHFDGSWGIFDDKMGKFVVDKMKQEKEPYLVTWYQLSSHGPYVLPKEYQGKYSSPAGSHEELVEYDDEVLRDFFAEMKKLDGYNNTLFVITADHSTDASHGVLNNARDKSRIPLIFFTPDGSIAPMIDYRATSQIDITPSILGHLNYDKPYFSLGIDIFNSDIRFATNCQDGVYHIVEDDYSLLFDGEKTIGLFDRKGDLELGNNILNEVPETAKKMEARLKAFIQEYTHRIVDNKMSVETICDSLFYRDRTIEQ